MNIVFYLQSKIRYYSYGDDYEVTGLIFKFREVIVKQKQQPTGRKKTMMTPKIEISDETYHALGSMVQGFETPDDVIKRLILEKKSNVTQPRSATPQTRSSGHRVPTTDRILEETYRLAKDIVENGADVNDALDYLAKDIGMNRGSANMFLSAFKAMREGELYTRTVSSPTTRYYLEQILADYGDDGLRLALEAVGKNIKYHESFLTGKKVTTRRIHAEFYAMLDTKVCPECSHVFQGKGWDGIDAHWRSKHEHIMPYDEAWPLIKSGLYEPEDD